MKQEPFWYVFGKSIVRANAWSEDEANRTRHVTSITHLVTGVGEKVSLYLSSEDCYDTLQELVKMLEDELP